MQRLGAWHGEELSDFSARATWAGAEGWSWGRQRSYKTGRLWEDFGIFFFWEIWEAPWATLPLQQGVTCSAEIFQKGTMWGTACTGQGSQTGPATRWPWDFGETVSPLWASCYPSVQRELDELQLPSYQNNPAVVNGQQLPQVRAMLVPAHDTLIEEGP